MRGRLLPVMLALPALASCGTTTTKTVTHVSSSTVTRTTTPTTSSTTPAVTTTSTTTAASPVYFQGVAGAPAERPGRLELTGDGTLFVSGVQWTAWGGSTASGSGNAEYHGCNPTCAQAPVHTAFVTIGMSGIRVCGGRQFYSGVTLRLNSGQLLDESFMQRSWSPC
jgi:hypothetical protein